MKEQLFYIVLALIGAILALIDYTKTNSVLSFIFLNICAGFIGTYSYILFDKYIHK